MLSHTEPVTLSAGTQVMLDSFMTARDKLTYWQQRALVPKRWSDLSECQYFLFHSYLEKTLALQNAFLSFSQVASEVTEVTDAKLQQIAIQFELALDGFLAASRALAENILPDYTDQPETGQYLLTQYVIETKVQFEAFLDKVIALCQNPTQAAQQYGDANGQINLTLTLNAPKSVAAIQSWLIHEKQKEHYLRELSGDSSYPVVGTTQAKKETSIWPWVVMGLGLGFLMGGE
jgi:hypothetical protein